MMAINSIPDFVGTYTKVGADLRSLKALQFTEVDLGDEPEDQNSEACKAWSDAHDEHANSPRFRVPFLAEGEADDADHP